MASAARVEYYFFVVWPPEDGRATYLCDVGTQYRSHLQDTTPSAVHQLHTQFHVIHTL